MIILALIFLCHCAIQFWERPRVRLERSLNTMPPSYFFHFFFRTIRSLVRIDGSARGLTHPLKKVSVSRSVGVESEFCEMVLKVNGDIVRKQSSFASFFYYKIVKQVNSTCICVINLPKMVGKFVFPRFEKFNRANVLNIIGSCN